MTDPDDAAWLDERHRELLLRILRTRPSSAAQLAQDDGGLDVVDAVGVLREAGYLDNLAERDVLAPIPPDAAVANIAAAALTRQRDSVDSLARLARQLPSMARAWDMGETPDDYDLRGEVISGDDNAMQRWFSITQQRPPLAPGTAYGDFTYIHHQVLPELDRTRAALEDGGYRLRVILPADQLADHANRDAADVLVSIGVDVRLATTVPTWLYVDSGVMAGIPLEWGAPTPDGFVLVYDPALIEPVVWLFERWWQSATPWPLEGAGWLPVMRLLARGRTDEQIAAVLGMGVRTVRRRIAEAMHHFGVSSRFELGMRWAHRAQPHSHVALDLDMGQLPGPTAPAPVTA